MTRLGLSLVFRGGREAIVRLVLVATGVAIGVCMLAFAFAGFNGLHNQDARWAWLETSARNTRPSVAAGQSDPLYWAHTEDRFEESKIQRVDIAATGKDSPAPPGVPRLPAQGEMYVSPALKELLRRTPEAELADRFPARVIGTISQEGLTAPDSLIALVGRSQEDMAKTSGVEIVSSVETAARTRSYTGFFRVVLGIGAIGLLFPVLIFIGTTTRLAAARREQRFAAMRLVGATGGQINALAAVEAGVAALAGTALGFALFWLLRPLVAGFPITGEPFFTGDLTLSPLMAVVICVGVPLGAIAAALVSLRRVRISPLGVTRQTARKKPRALRIIPLSLGLLTLALGMFIDVPDSATTVLVLTGFALTVIGLVVAGPWLTSAVTSLFASRARRVTTLLASRRLADEPKRAFRSISGLILAVFIVSVFTGVIVTVVSRSGISEENGLPHDALAVSMHTEASEGLPPDRAESFLASLEKVKGVEEVLPFYAPPPGMVSESGPTTGPNRELKGLLSAEDLRKYPVLGSSTVDGAVVAVPLDPALSGFSFRGERRDPVPIHATKLTSLPLEAVVVTTDGTRGAVERVRTSVENRLSFVPSKIGTVGELNAENMKFIGLMQKLAFFGIIVSLLIAGCSLAVSVAGGLVERKRPFSLLRVAGMPLSKLRRSVLVESAVPLTAVTAVSALLGLVSADLIFRTLVHTTSQTENVQGWASGIVLPGLAYYLVLVGGLTTALLLVILTLPLLRRLTEPENVRFE